MEYKNRIKNYGVYDEDPSSGRGFYTKDRRNGKPNAVPGIMMVPNAPLADVTNQQAREYVPTMNDYVTIKKSNGTELVRVIPKEPEMVPAETDFGWSKIQDSDRTTNHSALIPSAGYFFTFGSVLPDLIIKMVVINVYRQITNIFLD